MFKEMMEDILEFLPENITNNKVFKETMKEFLKQIPDNIPIEDIHTATNFSLNVHLTTIYPNLEEKININSEEKDVLNLTLFIQNGIIIYRLKDYGYAYYMEISFTVPNNTKKVMLTWNKKGTIVENIITTEKDNMLEDYQYDIYLYNKHGNLRKNIDVEKIKDSHFSNEFYVPQEEARKYRLNFKKYAAYLNKNRFIEINREYEKKLVDNTFHSPFSLEDLETYLLTEIDKDVALCMEEDYKPIVHQKTGKLDELIASIKSIIGASEEVIISDNLFQALSFYLMELNGDILYDKGMLINKQNNHYTLYYLHIESDRIYGIPKELTKDEINLILSSNQANFEVEGLTTFFEQDQTLK